MLQSKGTESCQHRYCLQYMFLQYVATTKGHLQAMRFEVFWPEDDTLWLKHVTEIHTADRVAVFCGVNR
jgi:hypothetical protein